MYSLEQRTDAIQLFIESGFNENAVIRSLGYPSPTMTIDCLDRDTIRRYRQRMDNLRPGHVYNRIAQDIKVPFKLEGTDRIDDTPLHKALREALANALIHADYYDRRGLVIQKWPDKIRIANPGAFRINVQEALVGGVSDPRNESLIKMFNLINVGERAGSGLPSIRSVWQKQGWQVPEIVEAFNPDRTTLTLPLSAAKMAVKSGGKKVAAKNGDKEGGIAERRKADILQYLTDTPKAASKEIAEAVGLQVSRTKMYLAELIEQEAVVAEGAGRARKYRLKT